MSDAIKLDEEHFNLEIRKFLKKVGITSQHEIESAVRAALHDGRLAGTETLKVQVLLSIPILGISHAVDGEIVLV
jgi:hypothetical protein